MFAQLAGDVEEDSGPLAWGKIAPTGFPRTLGGFDGSIDLGDIRSGHFTKRSFGCGVDQGCATTGLGITERAVYKELGGKIHNTSR